jgi:mono/diheme cytochrome c family protein
MSNNLGTRLALITAAICITGWSTWRAFSSTTQGTANPPQADNLEQQFSTQVKPFLERYCVSCHGAKKPKGGLDLTRDATVNAIAKNERPWELVLQRLQAEEMPPESAPRHPKADERAAVIAWIRELHDREAKRHAGDPGIVLGRRLSNAEFDYTIRDLTGVDIRPAREFPVDPANEAGFDNSGESLAMSPALLKKYLAAVRLVADHVVLKPEGFVFAPHPIVTDTDRDKYCVQRIIDFYARHQVDYADYFLAAWKYRHRVALGRPNAELSQFATDMGLSAKYLAMIWSALNDTEAEIGPLAAVRTMWKEAKDPQGAKDRVRTSEGEARADCERMRDFVVCLRKQLKPDVKKLAVNGISPGSQPLVLWKNRELASRHRGYSGDVLADWKKLTAQLKGADTGLAKLFEIKEVDTDKDRLRKTLEHFCNVFPDAFAVTDRGPYFDPKAADKGRPLTAGFHLMQGYFRDDQPLCDLILDQKQRRELDALWQELNFITLAPMRQFKDFIFFERAEPPRFMFEAEFDFARSEDKDCTSAAKISRLADKYLVKARKKGAINEAIKAIEIYFTGISDEIRQVERARLAAEPSHLEALVKFTERAYRRPITNAERDDVLAFYRKLRDKDELNHEEALRDTIASVLLSPHFCFRLNLAKSDAAMQPLSDYELANRLSYFLWSSMPDAELLSHAAAGDLHRPDELKSQTRRMLRDAKVRGLATEFGGNWLDFRRFEEHNAVDRERFRSFTNELRQAMFEEPILYLIDIAQRNRSVLDLLYGKDTFVNPVLAKHYGIPLSPHPAPGGKGEKSGAPRPSSLAPRDDWGHVEDADRYGRGGLLPMAVFLTKNAPGLRTSPVKRGYWVVRRVLGEQIPPPPPTVPELPQDESKLGELSLPQLLARHRADKSCAGCHRRFDAVGLVFEDFGPVGERRAKDLGGRPVDTAATFPDGMDRRGLEGLRQYLREKRQDDFVENLCKKLFSYALSRSLTLSDRAALDEMRDKLAADGYTFGSLVESIVTSRQFLNKRGNGDLGEQ